MIELGAVRSKLEEMPTLKSPLEEKHAGCSHVGVEDEIRPWYGLLGYHVCLHGIGCR
jgi:hypothetical protein